MPTQKEKLSESVKAYSQGKTKGNWYRSMLKGGYSEKYAGHSGSKLLYKAVTQALLSEVKAVIEAEDENSRVFVTRKMFIMLAKCEAANDRTNAVRVLEDLGKNVGWFAADNTQRAEQAKLDEVKALEAKRIARLLNEDTVNKAYNIIKLESA